MKHGKTNPALIKNFFLGTSKGEDFEEALELLHEMKDNPENSRLFEEFWNQDLYDHRIPDISKEEADIFLGGIHHRIITEKPNLTTQETRIQKLFTNLTKLAAILFIPTLVAALTYYFSSRADSYEVDSWITITSPLGSKIKTDLPDGTVIWQNAGSCIKYPRNYNKKNRHIMLTGEAYFNVVSDKKHPFFVTTKELKIKATGTRFNVASYKDEESSFVVLEEGNLFVENSTHKGEKELLSGYKYSYNENSGLNTISKVDVVTYVSWVNGKLIFRNDPLLKVSTSLRRWYNAEIILDDDTGNLLGYPFTLTIETETLPQVLDYLCQAAPLEYKIEYVPKEDDSSLMRPKYLVRFRQN